MNEDPNFDSEWLKVFHPADRPDRLMIWFPHGGASATSAFQLSKLLSGRVPIAAVQYPGRANRAAEPHAESFVEIADHVVDALRDTPVRSVSLIGHCMGAIVAFEVARRLERESNVTVERLIVSGSVAPNLLAKNAVASTDHHVRSDVHALGGTDARILADDTLLDVYLPALRADYRARDGYRYLAGQPLTCPITAMVGDVDPLIRLDHGVAAWEQYTTGGFELHTFDGGHFYFIDRIAAVAQLLAETWRRQPPFTSSTSDEQRDREAMGGNQCQRTT
ncbi:thioesterase II family protein [Rhodococcus daqingensis]|uniref:Thioesterase TesA n=1 Tax=Rhodococcus daqingensis TaxID=2479363 RepID=A0ABW2RWW4_9NOCA